MKSSRVIMLTEEDIRTAIQKWLHTEYPGDARPYAINLNVTVTTTGIGPMETSTNTIHAVATMEDA
jgi:hypothetical protein